MCDEEARACASTCPIADADGDGEAALACGGHACDDTDPNRFPGNSELCDPMALDEDCARDTLGPDLDHDGHQDFRCCNTWDGSETCGTDCDDGDPTVNPDRSELCTGRDDDCDGALDEGFERPAGQRVPGATACGNMGARRCSSSCDWIDDDLYVGESRATCDYCADSPNGLDEERAFATREWTAALGTRHGDAGRAGPLGGAVDLVGAAAGTLDSRVASNGTTEASSGLCP